MVRGTYGRAAVERAVVGGITRHGEGFVLQVRPADERDRTPNVAAPLPAADSEAPARPQA